MAKRVGFFSDLHGDKRNLDAIVRTLELKGVTSIASLGDMLYDTQTAETLSNLQRATKARTLIGQENPMREEVLDGNFSDEQLQRLAGDYEFARSTTKKIAKADYSDFKGQLEDFDIAILGGNWDHREEIQEVFGENYLNATNKSLEGVDFLGFSGGGLQPVQSFGPETLADDQDTERYEFRKWMKKLGSGSPLGADVLISHLPFTSGWNVKQDNATEHLKEAVLMRKKAGLDTPDVYMWGHSHQEATVEYNEELGGFKVMPGVAGNTHASGNYGTFIISEFNDDNKLVAVDEFKIYNSVAGLIDVELAGRYELDYENKDVEYTEIGESVINEFQPTGFRDNLTLDDNVSLKQRGFNLKYEGLDAKEKDLVLRQNLTLIKDFAKETSEKLKGFIDDAKRKMLCGRAADAELSYDDVCFAANEVQDKFSESAADIMHVDLSRFTNDIEQRMVRNSLVEAVYGIKSHVVNYALTEVKKDKMDAESVSGKWALEKELVGHVRQSIEKILPEQIKQDLEAEDYQEMIDELYLPLNMKRKRDLTLDEASQLWDNANEVGLLSYGSLESTGLFEEIEGFTPNRKTAQELEDMFQLNKNVEDDEESVASAVNESSVGSNVGSKIDQIRKSISNGAPVFREDDEGAKEYMLTTDGKKKYLGSEETDGLTYVPKTMQEALDDGQLKLVKLGNQEYVPNGKSLVPFDREKFGVNDRYQSDHSSEDMLRTDLLEKGVPEAEIGNFIDHLAQNGGLTMSEPNYQQQSPLDQLRSMPQGNNPFE